MYALQQAFKAIRHNWIASASTITTMTLALMILAGFSLLSINLNALLKDLQGELEMAVFLGPDVDAFATEDMIAAWSEVASTTLVLPNEALSDLLDNLDYLQSATQFIDNPLPATIELQLYDPSHTLSVRQKLSRLSGIDDIEDGSDAVASFIAIRDTFRLIGSLLILVLLFATLFAIINAIRAAITGRREEIEVMHLVGAARSFIRAPFLIEGFILALFSSIISIVVVVVSYQLAIANLNERLPLLPLVNDPYALLWISTLLLVLAILVGLIGSSVSVSHYLDAEGEHL